MKSFKQEDLIDKKILFSYIPTNRFAVQEGKVNEFSPSGKYIKINHEWYFLDKVAFLEVFSLDERPDMKFKLVSQKQAD